MVLISTTADYWFSQNTLWVTHEVAPQPGNVSDCSLVLNVSCAMRKLINCEFFPKRQSFRGVLAEVTLRWLALRLSSSAADRRTSEAISMLHRTHKYPPHSQDPSRRWSGRTICTNRTFTDRRCYLGRKVSVLHQHDEENVGESSHSRGNCSGHFGGQCIGQRLSASLWIRLRDSGL